MVAGWIVALAVMVVCGLVALVIVTVINTLDRTPSIRGKAEPESRPSDDEQIRSALPADGDRPRRPE
jgi:hypothetical protein